MQARHRRAEQLERIPRQQLPQPQRIPLAQEVM